MKVPRGRLVLLFSGVLLFSAVLAFAAPTVADENAPQILKAALAKLHEAKSYSAEVTTSLDGQEIKGKVLLMKPNFLRYECTGPQSMALVADGTAYHMHDRTGGRYAKLPLAARPTQLNGMWGAEIDAFFGGPEVESGKMSYVGEEKVDATDCHVVKVVKNDIDSAIYSIGKADGLIHRAQMVLDNGGGSPPQKLTTTLRNALLNPALTATDFRFTPPPGVKPLDMGAGDKLIKVGAKAPDFTLSTPSGSKVSLSGALKGRKAVILNFWFYH